MVFPVVGGDGKPTGYDIDNSLRFNKGDSPNVSNNPGGGSGSDGSRTQFSISMWVKRSTLGLGDNSKQQFLTSAVATNNFYGTIKFGGNDAIAINLINSGSDQDEIHTEGVFRDTNAWYHLFFAFDKTQASLADGVKLYVNGVLQSFSTTTYTQNQGYHFFRPGKSHYIGNYNGSEGYFDGYMAEVHFVDGQVKAHTDFGETNDNGVWIPKDYTGTHGTYGFHLEFKQTGTSENSSGIGADTSGNDEHFAVANLASTDVTTDTPTNNFATFNFIASGAGGLTNYTSRLSEGNLVADTTNNSDDFTYLSNFPTNMPFYYEMKFEDVHGSGNDQRVGITRAEKSSLSGSHATAEYRRDGGIYSFDSAGGNVASGNTGNQSFSDGDIIGVAADNTTNNNVKFYHNGTLQATIAIDSSETYMPHVRLFGDSTTTRVSANFGNPAFSISSGNADANGYGNFEYAVPSGYYALCTKNLAEYG